MYFTWQKNEEAREELVQADALWDSGKKADAVAKYKAVIREKRLNVPSESEKPVIYQRVIEFDVEEGNTDSAREFIELAFDQNVSIASKDKKVSTLVAQVRADRDKREAEERKKRDAEARRSQKPKRGELGYIEVEGDDTVWVAVDKAALDEMLSFARAKNEPALDQMMAQGRLLVCSKGTKVSVVDTGILTYTVRIMEGKHEGKTGVIATEFVHK